MKMNDFLNMNATDAIKLYIGIFQEDRGNLIQAGDTTYAITNATCVTGLEEKVVFELENVSRGKETRTKRTIKIEFKREAHTR